ncbi:MAG: hydroxyacylglutathione hydrolase [Deltaproteobacteria bacterium]
MTLELVTVPCLTDNYAYLLHNTDTGQTAIVDFPEAAPLLAALEMRDWIPSDGFITHHHDDHIQGLAEIRAKFPTMRVFGAKADAHRLPPLDVELSEGDVAHAIDTSWNVIDVSGHTVGHVALHVPAADVVFTADSLMAMGCGRLFEGTPAQMWESMQKLMKLPPRTIVCSGHEYTAANARFAMTIEPDNADLVARVAEITDKRSRNEPTVPSSLSLETATNPFLRAHIASVKAGVGMEGADDVSVFAEVRERKNRF